MMKSPIFVSGLSKSGTSMVKTLFDGHPDLFVVPPNELLFFFYSDLLSLNRIQAPQPAGDPNQLLRNLARSEYNVRMNQADSKDYREQFNVSAFIEDIDTLEVSSYAEAMEALFGAYARNCSTFDGDLADTRFLSKTIWETEYFPELLNWFGDMKFLYVLRNPYAHFHAALKSMRAGEKGREGMALTWRNRFPFIGRQLALMRTSYCLMRKYQRLFPKNFHVLVFDRLLEDPEAELKRVCEFLDMDFHPVLRQPTILGQPWGGNSWYVDNYDAIDKRPLTHWRKKISKLEIKYVNQHFQDVVEEFGFEVLAGNCSILRPFHFTEIPLTYIANRVMYFYR
jgi:protein-tyrosine sulfotransferase